MRTLTRLALLALLGLLVAGCSGDLAAEQVKEKDKQREDAAKNMPGNDVPKDPADGR